MRRKASSSTLLAIVGVALVFVAACDDDEKAAEVTPEAVVAAAPIAENVTATSESESAKLKLTIQSLGYLFKDGRHRYTQHRHFSETAGIGVTLTSGKVCVSRGKECVSAKLNYRIDANTEKSRRNQYVATTSIPDIATVEYDGVDDNGYPVHVEVEFVLDVPAQ